MKLYKLLLESKNISITELEGMIEKSEQPVYVVVAGSLGSGKSFLVNKHLPGVDSVDQDEFNKKLGGGVYTEENVKDAMAMVRQTVAENFANKKTFIQQGTSSNLQIAINKLKSGKQHGFVTVLLYVDTPIEQAVKQVEKRLSSGGHGETIGKRDVEVSSAGAKLTFRALTGVDFDKATEEDIQRVKLALDKTEKTLDNARKNLDYFVRIENKY